MRSTKVQALTLALLSSCAATEQQNATIEDLTFPPIETSSLATRRAAERDSSRLLRDEKTMALQPRVLEGRNCNGKLFQIEISPEHYMSYQNRETPRGQARWLDDEPEQLRSFVTPADPIVTALATALSEGAKSPEEKAQQILNWVCRSVHYDECETDGSASYLRYPVETLMEQCGDCEDTTLLLASLYCAAELDVVIIRQFQHLSLGVHGAFSGKYHYEYQGKRYYLAESSVMTPSKIGELRGRDDDVPNAILLGLDPESEPHRTF
jgi:hypothetical protein